MEKLEYRIFIACNKQKVWDTMLHPAPYKQWIAGSWPDSFYEGNGWPGALTQLKQMCEDKLS